MLTQYDCLVRRQRGLEAQLLNTTDERIALAIHEKIIQVSNHIFSLPR